MIQVENLTKTINNQMILEDISIDICAAIDFFNWT